MAGRFFFTALATLALVLALGSVAGCAGPRSDAAVITTPAPGKPAAVARTASPPVAAAPAAPSPTVAAPSARPGVLNPSSRPGDLACKSDADCEVKDVGSCCGYRPQCLNRDAKTFPEQVKAKCAREGRVSTCGMLAVAGCQCLQGKCAALLQSDNSSLVR